MVKDKTQKKYAGVIKRVNATLDHAATQLNEARKPLTPQNMKRGSVSIVDRIVASLDSVRKELTRSRRPLQQYRIMLGRMDAPRATDRAPKVERTTKKRAAKTTKTVESAPRSAASTEQTVAAA